MDVRLPDGTIIKGVPDGMSKADLTAKLQANGYDVSKLTAPAVPQLPESLRPRIAAPEGIPAARQEADLYSKVRPYVAPVVEALGAGGGALFGGAAGGISGSVIPFAGTAAGAATGGVIGAGLGYGAAKEVLELADVYLGGKSPRQGAAQITEPVRNVLEGTTFEAGGRVAGPIIAKGVGKLADLRRIPKNKAADIARNALGPDLPEALNALKASQGKGVSAAQATADINSPTWQALIDRATARDPRFLSALEKSQGDVSLNALSKLAGGTTAAEARGTTEAAKEAARTITSPMRESALDRANLGKEVARLEKLSAELGEQAATKVQEVRRLMELGDLAKARQQMVEIKTSVDFTAGLDIARTLNTFSGQAPGAGRIVGKTQPKGTPVDKLFANFADDLVKPSSWRDMTGRNRTPDQATSEAIQEFRSRMFERANRIPGAQSVASVVDSSDGFSYVVQASPVSRVVRVQLVDKDGVVKAAARLDKGMVDSIAATTKGNKDGTRLLKFIDDAGIGNIHEVPDRSVGFVNAQKEILSSPTYRQQLAEKAFNEWSNKAAQASLDLGQGARFADQAAGALRAQGIKPLEGEPLVRSLRTVANNPEFAGNDVLLGALRNVSDDIAKWTSSGGIIDARALDAIRKNSVNAAIQQLRPGMDATSQRNLAAGVLSRVKPAIDDAIETAGGAGYREYLKEHAKLSQKIAEKQLTGEALQLWKTDKNAFVRLVQNESPEAVEKILGPGKYNIAVELAEDTLGTLQSEAAKVIRNANIKSQVEGGQTALKELLLQSMSKFRLPSYLSAVTATTNKALNILENKIGQKTMVTLTEALKTPSGAANLLESLPATERNRVLQIIADPTKWSAPSRATVTGGTAAAVNMLAPERNVENEFIR